MSDDSQPKTLVPQRELGRTGIRVSPIAMGCWPIAGVTSLNVNERDSIATIEAALECGVNFFDTAYCYGYDGESERLLARVVDGQREQVVIATKGGIAWGPDRERVVDGRPETLRRHCEESLRRLGVDHVELLYLHAPDPNTPLAESAGALKDLMSAGKTRSVGLSNANVAQLEAFAAVCPLAAYQPKYNMLQREIEAAELPWCREHHVSVLAYWPLLKGLLAGGLRRDHVFQPGDGRAKYPMFQGVEWQRNQDLLDELRVIATESGESVAQLTLAWTIAQPGITAALCGAKRARQMQDNAGALRYPLTADQCARIDAALARRGAPVSVNAV